MKKQLVFLIMISFLISALSLAFYTSPLPAQQQICAWQKVKETPNTTVSGTALDATASLNGSTVTIIWKGLIIVHSWTAPPATLTPGEELFFEVSTAWDLDRNSDLNSVGGLNTYINLNWMQTVEARIKSINFSSEPSGSIENSTTWSVPGSAQPGATLEIIGFADAAVAGGNVRYMYEYQCVDPTPANTETPFPTETVEPTAAITPTPGQCEELTEEEKLEKILALYYERIPKGIASSGEKNNILDFLGYPGYDEFACGGYQSKVIDFLAHLKFSKDPCEQALLEKWDYGPIHAWRGYHQAVVIYPWATNWMETGIVLDPWIEQRPMVYPIDKWAIHFSYAGLMGAAGRLTEESIDGSFIGIGPSAVYEKSPEFPMFGGTYAMPGAPKLTKEENEFLKTLPEEKQELFKKLSKTQQKYWLSMRMGGKDSAQQVVTDCPLVLYVTDEEGLRSGIASDGIYYELDDVLFSAFPLQDGTAYTELIYPLGAGYRLVMEGTGEGQAYVLVQDWVDFERDGQGVALYQLTVTEGALYESMIPKDELSWDGGSIQPELLAIGTEATWLNQLPGLADVGGTQNAGSSLPDWLPGWRVMFLGGFIELLLGLAGLVVLGVLIAPAIISKRAARNKPGLGTSSAKNSKMKWIFTVLVVMISCLAMICGSVSLYLGITGG